MSRKKPSLRKTDTNIDSQQLADLQSKIEEYERNAAVEAALDKVRTASTAMYKSEDVSDAVAIIFQELESLDLSMVRCGLGIFSDKNRTVQLWTTTSIDGENTVQITGDEPLEGHPLLNKIYDNWKPQKDFSYTLEGEGLIAYHNILATTNFQLPDSRFSIGKDQIEYYRAAYFTAGGLYVFARKPFTEEALRIIRRFADVFHLTYTRYQDLQKLEKRAREAQIEAALERVRSTSLAMHNSDDLQKVIFIVFEQLNALGISMDVSFLQIFDESKDTIIWVANPQHQHAHKVHIPYFKNAILDRVLQAQASGEPFFSDQYSKRVKNNFYRKAFRNFP